MYAKNVPENKVLGKMVRYTYHLHKTYQCGNNAQGLSGTKSVVKSLFNLEGPVRRNSLKSTQNILWNIRLWQWYGAGALAVPGQYILTQYW